MIVVYGIHTTNEVLMSQLFDFDSLFHIPFIGLGPMLAMISTS